MDKNFVMNKIVLKGTVEKCIEENVGLTVYLTVPGQSGLEEITNPPQNLKYKLNYYLDNYEEVDDVLVLKHNHDIKMVMCVADGLDDSIIEDKFLGEKVKDIYSKLEGVVTSVSYDCDGTITGLVEYLHNGEFKTHWFDINRLRLLNNESEK